VFSQVWKPFCAFINPADAARLKLAAGDWVDAGGLQLPVKPADWVLQGSVVINDLHHAQPANRLHGAASVTLKRIDRPQPAASDTAVVATAGGGQ
jgi:anaerobic selenocysteine-containing dehydrogenase